jgi:hypothetical protein
MAEYFHDPDRLTLYIYGQLKSEPIPSKGKTPLGWTVSVKLEILTAKNSIEDGRWLESTSATPTVSFYCPQYESESNARIAFNIRHSPKGQEITKEQFDLLKSSYVLHGQG